jgi:hypothetical protein
LFLLGVPGTVLPATGSTTSPLRNQVAQHEATGDVAGARALLEEAASAGDNAEAQAVYAEFLDRHRLPGRREAYLKWASLEPDKTRKLLALREAVLVDVEDGKSDALNADVRAYRDAGGSELSPPVVTGAKAAELSKLYSNVSIPGPLSSFARMAALSPDLAPEELLPALARNVVTNGYQAISANEALEPTEYLKLLLRYVAEARELEELAGKDHAIVVPACDSEQTANLLKILGYRMRGSCGTDVVLETVNATKAFITVDSGFPLAELERDLRANRRFELPYAPTTVPVLYSAAYWLSALGKENGNFLDGFLSDPSLCRLYLGLSKLDRPTAEAMRQQASAARLKVYAHVLDFYGNMFEVRNGAAVVPGSPQAWAELAGASPKNGGAFFEKILSTDDGWLASYFDALARIDGPTAAYLTEPARMKKFYWALKGKITTPGPARPVFRSSTELMLLTTGLRIDSNGQPHIPGDIDVWRNLFIKHPHGKYDGKLTRAASSWRNSDDVLEALFALCRKQVENEPLKIFLAENDVDRRRAQPISPALATRMANDYRAYSSQYSIFADAPGLSEASINRYLDLPGATSKISDTLVRQDTIGSVQALVGIWGILCRQGSIPLKDQDQTFAALIEPFVRVKGSSDVFDADRAGVTLLLSASHAPAGSSEQDRLVDVLVGKPVANPERPSAGEYFLRVFDAQRLIPLDTLFAVGDRIGKGSGDTKALANLQSQLARFEETQSVRTSLSAAEKSLLSVGYWSERHIEQERKVNLDAVVKSADKKDARAALTPFLRDTLVGFLYAYYAPPGAQLLLANPLFVRNHDFIGSQGLVMSWHPTEISGTGWPASAGGRLTGSLTQLPYVLAESEQNFLTPTREQALIWGDLVPQMIVNVTVARWHNVAPEQIKWVALHMRRGEDLLAAATLDAKTRELVLAALGRFANPARVEKIDDDLSSGNFARASASVLPSELFALGTDPSLKPVARELSLIAIEELSAASQSKLDRASISAVFGTPKPTLTHSYQPELLNLRTFPTLMGYSSRILAETWESNGLYYAALADEMGIPVGQLDSYVPDWTRATIENIFATHLEDWPALLRSLRTVGDTVRQQSAQKSGSANTGAF